MMNRLLGFWELRRFQAMPLRILPCFRRLCTALPLPL
jgi:hypothetical protein